MKKQIPFFLIYIIFNNFSFAQITYGIDVSHYQSPITTSQWSQVVSYPKYFSYVKCSEGYTGPDDAYFQSNMSNGRNAGLKMGAYHLAHPENNSATNEASHFLGLSINYLGSGYLPSALDMEPAQIDAYMNQGHSWSDVANWINTWATSVYNNGHQVWPVLYVTGYYASHLAPYYPGTINQNIKLWFADYPNSNPGNPSSPSNWPWLFEQYSKTGSAAGMNPLDLDVFHGSITDLNNLAGGVTCTVPVNDNCPGSLITSNGSCLSGTVACATGSYGANQCSGCTCTSPDDYDVYYYFTAAATSETVTLSNYASNFDAVMELRTACSTGTALGCYDPSGTPTSSSYTWSNLTVGQTYYIRIFEFNYGGTPPSAPTFNICLTHSASGQPDLTITSGTQTITPTTICAGTNVSVSCSEDNSGNAASGANSVSLWLSADATLSTGSDIYLGNITGFPALSASSNSLVYTNSSLTIPANTAAGTYYLFFWADGLNGSNVGNVVVESNESNNFASRQLTINPLPSQPSSISGSVSVCNGGLQSYSISPVSGATNYTWALPSSWSSNGSTTTSINTSVGSSGGTISVTANNNCGSSTASTLAVNVNQIPSQPGVISGAATVCQGTSQTYSISPVSGATGYTWTLPSGWIGSSSSSSITTSAGSTGGTISVVAYNNCGSSTSRIFNVSMGAVPSQPGSISGTVSVCQGSSQTYSIANVGGANDYTWSLPTGWAGSSSTNSITVTVGNNAGSISVTANNSCGSSTPRVLPISINPLPSQPGSIGGAAAICQNTLQTYSISSVAGTTSYSWSYSGSGSPSGIGTSTTFIPLSSGVLTVVANNNCGNSSQSSLSITITQTPAQPGAISGNVSVCQGASQTYAINTVPNATSYTWILPSGWSGISSTNSINANIGSLGGTISVTASNSCGTSIPNTLSATSNQVPTVSINPSNISICSGGTGVALQAVGSAQSYSWSPSSGLNTVSGPSVTANPSLSTTYTVTASNGNCTAQASALVTVSNQAVASINPNNPILCSGSSVTLMASTGSAYVWSGPSGFSSTSQSVSVSNVGTYTVVVTNPGGCTGTATANVSVTQNPPLIIDAGIDTINSGTGISIGGQPTASGGQQPYSYSWTPTNTLNNSSIANPTVNPTVITTYTVIVTDHNNCSASDNVVVSIPSNCSSYTLSSANVNVPFTAGNDSLIITTGSGCPWSITGGCSWVTFINTTGIGSSVITFSYQPNPLTSTRTCFVNIEGNLFTITQAPATSCVPVADFSAFVTAGFASLTDTFYDNSSNSPTQWQWSFAGGSPNTSSAQKPVVVYNNGGIFDVSLKVTNACGTDSITKSHYVNVLGGPSGIAVGNISREISIFPNPNSGKFMVEVECEKGSRVNLNIFNSLGELISVRNRITSNNTTLLDCDLSDQSKGIYFIQILLEDHYYYSKVVVE